ncbi:unnamed protein product [Trichogramma brassicae]|uniref:Uncharacterized protein n=1 Tax=Trichogramma brassicae TaxID=86971 RepID=A0A6H5HZM4_9HYME|nr:unnamed protein product [Trichogramma brassicae]
MNIDPATTFSEEIELFSLFRHLGRLLCAPGVNADPATLFSKEVELDFLGEKSSPGRYSYVVHRVCHPGGRRSETSSTSSEKVVAGSIFIRGARVGHPVDEEAKPVRLPRRKSSPGRYSTWCNEYVTRVDEEAKPVRLPRRKSSPGRYSYVVHRVCHSGGRRSETSSTSSEKVVAGSVFIPGAPKIHSASREHVLLQRTFNIKVNRVTRARAFMKIIKLTRAAAAAAAVALDNLGHTPLFFSEKMKNFGKVDLTIRKLSSCCCCCCSATRYIRWRAQLISSSVHCVCKLQPPLHEAERDRIIYPSAAAAAAVCASSGEAHVYATTTTTTKVHGISYGLDKHNFVRVCVFLYYIGLIKRHFFRLNSVTDKMEKLRFEFVMKAAADKKSNALMVTSITTPDGEIFDIPAELQEVSLHTELMKTDIYKKIKNTNLKRNQKRNVWILLNAELKAAPPEEVFQAIKKEGFRLKFSKCAFAKDSVKYLGHIIQNNSVKPLNDNLISIKKFPVPTTKKEPSQDLSFETSNALIVKYLREVTPYFRKASIIQEVGWELQRGFLSATPPPPKSPPRADTRYLPLQLCRLTRSHPSVDPEMHDLVEPIFKISEERHRPLQVDAVDNSGRTPLHRALAHSADKHSVPQWYLLEENGRIDSWSNNDRLVVRRLLENGADPNLAVCNEDGFTPLHVICQRDQVYIFRGKPGIRTDGAGRRSRQVGSDAAGTGRGESHAERGRPRKKILLVKKILKLDVLKSSEMGNCNVAITYILKKFPNIF